MLKHTCTTLSITVCLTALCSSAVAQDGTSLEGFIAGGVASRPDFEGSDDYELAPLVSAKIAAGSYVLEALGDDLQLNVSPFERLEFGPALSLRSGRDNEIENETIARMREIDDAVEAGAFAKLSFPSMLRDGDEVSLNIKWLGDVSDTYEGSVATFGISYNVPVTRRFTVGASASTHFASEEYNQTYFGVDAENAALSGLDLYEAGSGIKDAGLTLSGRYMLTDRIGLVGFAGYKAMLGDAADSPIISQQGNDAQIRVGFGLGYRF